MMIFSSWPVFLKCVREFPLPFPFENPFELASFLRGSTEISFSAAVRFTGDFAFEVVFFAGASEVVSSATFVSSFEEVLLFIVIFFLE